jgi:hypothetical protein
MVQLNHEMLILNEMQNFHWINLLPLQTNEYRNPRGNEFFSQINIIRLKYIHSIVLSQ